MCAMVMKVFFPELDLWISCFCLAGTAGLYTAAGGLAAVVYTDILQSIVLFFGSCLLTYLAFAHPSIDFNWSTILEKTDPAHLSLINPVYHPISDPQLPWLGTLLGVPILGFYYWVTNQYITQRLELAE